MVEQQQPFNPYAGWPSPSKKNPGRKMHARRRPLWTDKHYTKIVAHYLEQGGRRGGLSILNTVNTRGGNPPASGTQEAETRTISADLDIIRELRTKTVRSRNGDEVPVSTLADCGRLWSGGAKATGQLHPCGCGDICLCPLDGVANADGLAADGVEQIREVRDAAVAVLGESLLENYGGAAEFTIHRSLSAKLEELLASDG